MTVRKYHAAPLFTALLAAILSVACLSDGGTGGSNPYGLGSDAPDWAQSGQVDGIPAGTYLVGHGVSSPGYVEADALDMAKLRGLEEISQQIEVKVKSEFTSKMKLVMDNDDIDQLTDVESFSKLESVEILAGAEIARKYYDKETGTGVVIVKMNRAKLSERLLRQATESQKQVNAHLGFLGDSKSGGDISAALKSLVHAHHGLVTALSKQGKAFAVGTTASQKSRFDALELAEFWNQVTREYDLLAGSLRLEPVSGNKQRAGLSGHIKNPIKVRVTWKGQALAGFPAAVRLADDQGSVIVQNDTTDRSGLFTFELREMKATGQHSNTVTATLDFNAVEKKSTLAAPSCEVSYLMPTKKTTRIAVIFHETIDGQPISEPFTSSHLKETLGDMGFLIVTPELRKPVREVVRLSPRALADLLGDLCDYAIVGTAEATVSTQGSASAYHRENWSIFYKTRAVMDALELESGNTIRYEVPREKTKFGGRKDKKMQVAQDSLKLASEMMSLYLSGKFAARFEAGEEWKK